MMKTLTLSYFTYSYQRHTFKSQRKSIWNRSCLPPSPPPPAPHYYTCTDADDIQQVSLWCPTHNTGSMCLPSPVYLWEKLWKHNVLENQQSNQSWTNVQRAWQQYGCLHQSFIHLSTRRHCLQHDQSPIHSDDRKLQKRARTHVYNIHFRIIIRHTVYVYFKTWVSNAC